MRITAAQYAKTLYDLTKGKGHKEIDGVILDFAKILQKNGQMKLVKSVTKKFEEIYNRENGIIVAEVVSKEKLNSQLVDKLSSFIRDRYKAKDVIVNNKIDDSVKGGVVIRVGDEIMDASVSKQLSELKKKLTTSI